MSGKEIRLKQFMSLEEAIEYLKEFTAGMDGGKIYLQKDDTCLEMTPGPDVKVEVKAKQKKGHQKFTHTISWAHVGEEIKNSFNIRSARPEGAKNENQGEGRRPKEEESPISPVSIAPAEFTADVEATSPTMETLDALRKQKHEEPGDKKRVVRTGKKTSSKDRKTSERGSSLEKSSRENLYKKAKRLGIEGRSRMSKKELAKAISGKS